MLNRYRFGFDGWGLAVFLLVMAPNVIWFAVPAPNDVLQAESVTSVVDAIASMLQVLTVACLCLVINKERTRLRLSPLVVAAGACVVVYYFGWAVYYCGVVRAWGILLLTVPPCLAFILFATVRKNIPAALLATGFAVCHLIFALKNFIL